MSIQNELDKIKGINQAMYGSEVRLAIHDALLKVYDDAAKSGNANMEVSLARGNYPTLRERLLAADNKQAETTSQLAQTVNGIKPNWSVWEEFKQRSFNVKWFGAVGDGITDDADTIQTAIDFIHSNGGGTLSFPVGTYLIGKGIINKENVHFVGAFGLSVIKTITPTFRMLNSASNNNYFGMTFDGNRGNERDDGNTTVGMLISAKENIKISHCIFKETKSDGIYIRSENGVPSNEIDITHSVFERNGRQGIASIDSINVTIAHNQFKDIDLTGIDFELQTAYGNDNRFSRFNNNFFNNCQQYAIWTKGGSADDRNADHTITNNQIYSCGEGGIVVEALRRVLVSLNHVVECAGIGIDVIEGCLNTKVGNNYVYKSGAHGVNISKSQKTEVLYNTIIESGGNGVETFRTDTVALDNIRIEGNTIEKSVGLGIGLFNYTYYDDDSATIKNNILSENSGGSWNNAYVNRENVDLFGNKSDDEITDYLTLNKDNQRHIVEVRETGNLMTDNVTIPVLRSGAGSLRPDSVIRGETYFNTSTNKPNFWTGSKWVNADGTDA